MGRNKRKCNNPSLKKAIATVQYHDVVAGTSKHHIANEWKIKDISGDKIFGVQGAQNKV